MRDFDGDLCRQWKKGLCDSCEFQPSLLRTLFLYKGVNCLIRWNVLFFCMKRKHTDPGVTISFLPRRLTPQSSHCPEFGKKTTSIHRQVWPNRLQATPQNTNGISNICITPLAFCKILIKHADLLLLCIDTLMPRGNQVLQNTEQAWQTEVHNLEVPSCSNLWSRWWSYRLVASWSFTLSFKWNKDSWWCSATSFPLKGLLDIWSVPTW